jgi:ribonuclease HII
MNGAVVDIPTLSYERDLDAEGIRIVAGVDEVGRGALAGPLMAAAVVLPPIERLLRDADFWGNVRDSKTISATRRTLLASEIIARAVSWSVSAIEPDELDELGVGPANRIAMERAVLGLDAEPEVLLIDAMTIESSAWQIGIIDGDALSLSIAAASIVAKVARDTLMIEAEADWPAYGFSRHKGYGVPSHIAALHEHGPCLLHRRCFAPVRLAQDIIDARQKA